MPTATRKCAYCKERKQRGDMVISPKNQAFCSLDHMTSYAKQAGAKLRQKNQKKADRKKLKQLQPLSHWLQLTQRVFNDYIRLRDRDKPCVSCGRSEAISWHAGHYRTTKAASQLRFNEDNCHKQCDRCNVYLSGNIEEYRKELVKRIGEDRVQALENNNELADYNPEVLEKTRKKYRTKINELNACS